MHTCERDQTGGSEKPKPLRMSAEHLRKSSGIAHYVHLQTLHMPSAHPLPTRSRLFPGSRLPLLSVLAFAAFLFPPPPASAAPALTDLDTLWETHCLDCHEGPKAKAGFDLAQLPRDLQDRAIRERWIRVYDQIERGEMPPKKGGPLSLADRGRVLGELGGMLREVENQEVSEHGRGPLRRMNRDEYQNNLRDVLKLPDLDVRDMLPEDREAHRFNKASESLDMSREQLTAYLEGAETALRAAVATKAHPPETARYRAVGTDLFPSYETFGNREAMFFAKDDKAVALSPKMPAEELKKLAADESLELALFRSAHWPYFGYPKRFLARTPGKYRVRFSARAVRQLSGFTLVAGDHPVPMTFRARKPSGPDVSGDVRATGGILDIQPEGGIYETVIQLREGETFEYSLLGLPVPLAFNVKGGPPIYRYPPFPESGQPGVGFRWLEVEGPLPPEVWPPESHRVLFDALPVGASPSEPKAEALRLLRRFLDLALREPVSEEDLKEYETLVISRLERGDSFEKALLAGYQAVLSSPQFLYLREPERPADHFAIADRLSHFLTNTRPDASLGALASAGRLRDRGILRGESQRLIAGKTFERFIENFTGYWLNLRHIRRDDPDIRLFPEYRFDEYLVESMERETREFVTAMFRENLPAKVLVDADFVYANDRLSQHYGLEPLQGSALRKVRLPKESPYGGLLTAASVLKVTTNGSSTSPVLRGAWIMERIIGRPPPPRPPVCLQWNPTSGAQKPSANCWPCTPRTSPAPGAMPSSIRSVSLWRASTSSADGGPATGGWRKGKPSPAWIGPVTSMRILWRET